MTFEVINLFTGWSHGSFATLRQARVAAERMHLSRLADLARQCLR